MHVIVSLLWFISSLSFPAAADPASFTTYLPLIQQALDRSGTWQGAIVQTDALYTYDLTLNADLTGSARIRDGTYFATMDIHGSTVLTTTTLVEERMTATNGVPMGRRWCLKTLSLTPDTLPGTLSGTWKQDGCNTGHVFLQRSPAPAQALAPAWSGTLLQASTPYSFTLALAQDDHAVTGTSTISTTTTSATMQIWGRVVGDHVLLQEQRILHDDGSHQWCVKVMQLHLGQNTLTGSWSALGCTPGTMHLTQKP